MKRVGKWVREEWVSEERWLGFGEISRVERGLEFGKMCSEVIEEKKHKYYNLSRWFFNPHH